MTTLLSMLIPLLSQSVEQFYGCIIICCCDQSDRIVERVFHRRYTSGKDSIQAKDFSTGTCSIGHPTHSSASPVELRLRVGPRALSGKKKNLGNGGC